MNSLDFYHNSTETKKHNTKFSDNAFIHYRVRSRIRKFSLLECPVLRVCRLFALDTPAGERQICSVLPGLSFHFFDVFEKCFAFLIANASEFLRVNMFCQVIQIEPDTCSGYIRLFQQILNKYFLLWTLWLPGKL